MTVDLKEVGRYLLLHGREPDPALARRMSELRDEVRSSIRPARVWRRFAIEEGAIASGGLRLDLSGSISRIVGGCRSAYLACGTLGAGFDALHRRVSTVSGADALIVQAIGAAAIEAWMDETEVEISRELAEGESLAVRYSPGYGDFPLEAQRTLLALLDAPRKVGVSLTDSLLMVPSKSVSAIIGVKTP